MSLRTPITQDDHYRGSLMAPVTLVEYGDFQCPYCAGAFPLLERVFKENKDTMCFVYRQFPLTTIHPRAGLAAMAAEAAHQQKNFWPMHHLLFMNQERVSEKTVLEMAEELALDLTQFYNDLYNPKLKDNIWKVYEDGVRSGVKGTPTLFLNGEIFDQPRSYNSLSQAIRELAGQTDVHTPLS